MWLNAILLQTPTAASLALPQNKGKKNLLFEQSGQALVSVNIVRWHVLCLTLKKHLFSTNYVLRTVLVW